MTCANTLYGVTMQESGISKRVSVRFEDVSENGEITAFTQPAEEPSSSQEPSAPATKKRKRRDARFLRAPANAVPPGRAAARPR